MAASVAEKTYNFAPKKYNTRGRPIPIYANYFPINIRCKTVYRYGIDIQQSDFVPNKEDKKVPQRNKMAQQKRILKENNFAIFEVYIYAINITHLKYFNLKILLFSLKASGQARSKLIRF